MSTVSTTTRTRTAETAAASVPASSAASMRYDAPIATANRSDGAPVVQRLASESDRRESFEETPLWCALSTYLIWGLYIIIAYVRTFLAKIGVERVKHKEEAEKNTKVGAREVSFVRAYLGSRNKPFACTSDYPSP